MGALYCTGIYPLMPLPALIYLLLIIRFYEKSIVLLSCITEPTVTLFKRIVYQRQFF